MNKLTPEEIARIAGISPVHRRLVELGANAQLDKLKDRPDRLDDDPLYKRELEAVEQEKQLAREYPRKGLDDKREKIAEYLYNENEPTLIFDGVTYEKCKGIYPDKTESYLNQATQIISLIEGNDG